MINLYNIRLPFDWRGLTLWPFILYRDAERDIPQWLRRHEEYHWYHQLRWGIIPWFLAYGILLLLYGYRNHPFEKLAREAENERI